ncbi:hypothetical protein KVR01_007787 [Diaporthe batatas]|uniref:uncharacterized protein n=1 Tax=Diaporthe batatas TaxID=748121 RepID=UPI001D041779|nr:uncharacterized protein KVR01_007787 [Diaporthe batatas]KAG8162022.1 hypothetical protein KVR01_007787 [Diaporthe batatas]
MRWWAEEIRMTSSDVDSLLEAYRTRRWTVRQVTTAFLKKAVIMNQLTNFTAEFLAHQALSQADALDTHQATTDTLKGPLHGIPTSLAEPIPLPDHTTAPHCGIVSRITTTTEPTPPLLHLASQLRKAGAVLHLRTNTNQALIGHLACENNILGRTLNPLDRRLSPGGPCGGEGVAVGSGCAVLGVAMGDVGGVGLLPAAFGGDRCYGFKPTSGTAVLGAADSSGVGPLARSVEGLRAWMEATAPGVSPGNPDLGSFTVGVLRDDGIATPHPPVRRALTTAAEKLRSAAGVSVRVVEWAPHDHARAHALNSRLCFPDGGRRFLDEFAASGERPVPSVVQALDEARRSCVAGLEGPVAVARERERYQREHDALMAGRGVDFILGPAYVGAGALRDDASGYSHYTSVWEVLDLPSVVMPSGLRCDRAVDVKDETYVPESDVDRAVWAAYDPELFDGFPVALQLVGRRAKDEEVLTAAGVLDKILNGGS